MPGHQVECNLRVLGQSRLPFLSAAPVTHTNDQCHYRTEHDKTDRHGNHQLDHRAATLTEPQAD